MRVTFKLSPELHIPFITINADRKTPDLNNLAHHIEQITDAWHLEGQQAGRTRLLTLSEIISCHTDGKHVICETTDGPYQIKQRIYELAEQLPADMFIQISSGEILAISAIQSLTLTKAGSYQINLTNQTTTFTSRRYMRQLRKRFLK